MKKINIITPYRKGGPWYWGSSLAHFINKSSDEFKAQHIYKLSDIILSPFFVKADIVQSVNPIVYRLWRKPYILTIKGNFNLEKDNPFSYLYPKAIEKATIVTVPSQYLKKELGLKKAIVIPNAVDLGNYKRVASVGNRRKKLIILTVTKFYFKDKAEGVLNILKILEQIIEKDKIDIEYIVLGSGKYLEEIKSRSKKYKVNVKFKGFGNSLEYMQKADIFVYYSKHDNMPNALMEAMACGLPVIVNKVGAIPEMIENGKSGLIAKNMEEFYNKLRQVIRSKQERIILGRESRERIEKIYSWETVIMKWIELYKSISK